MGGSNCDRNFYPRSPCGERHTKHFPALHHILISIHALLAESDAGAGNNAIGISYFYPRSPCGERRNADCNCRSVRPISIHALLAESDSPTRRPSVTPHIFLSTLSLRRATAKVHKTVGHFCAYETNFMEIASSC